MAEPHALVSPPGSFVNQPLEAEDAQFRDDEGYQESSTSSLLSSIATEIREGKIENGRIYANYGKHEYGLPIDDPELDRLDLNHTKYYILQNDRHFLAPIGQDPQKVLDIGTGTGIWAIDFADSFPSASVIGTDLAPVQPQWVPPNCEFQIDDAEGEWTFEKNTFDYIHARDLYHGIRDFPRLIRQSFDTLRPGGWIEFAALHPQPGAIDDSLDPNSSYMELVNAWNEIGRRIGVDPDSAKKFKMWFRDQGFEEVREFQFRVPCSPWPKDPRLKRVGAYELLNVVEGGKGFMLRGWTKDFGLSREELERCIDGIRKELPTNRMRAYVTFIVVVGRKPGGQQNEDDG